MTTDLFDNKIICKDCKEEMQKIELIKNGFKLRAVECARCGQRIIHPADVEEFKRFSELKKRDFNVKLRMVGNSYAVSIPREIVDFMHEQEKMMDDMVRLCFEEAGRLSLMFGTEMNVMDERERLDEEKEKGIKGERKIRIIRRIREK
jgi:DNA-directed RNA polymerase subunit RPC12/RpoP